MNETWWVAEGDLDNDQKRIAALPPSGSHLITGPPGCGKTNLLLLRAKYFTKLKKENILVLVFTRALRDFIISGSKQYHLPSEIVRTHMGWARAFLRAHSIKVDSTDEFSNDRTVLLQRVKEVVEAQNLSDVYEAIFLDEAQDYLPAEIELFGRLAKEIYAAADPRQKIYKGADSTTQLRSLVDAIHPLRYHYRLGLNICRVADSIFVGTHDEPLLNTSSYDEGSRPSRVEVVRCRNEQVQADAIIEALKLQLDAYPDELLGVMCPHRSQRDRLYELISASDIGDLAVNQSDNPEFESNKPIYVTTLHSSKGLEYRAAHLAYAEAIRGFSQETNMTYTAVTRTKTILTVYALGEPPGYLLQAINSLETPPSEPKLADLFD
jgi:superfamily I DNA and RNA helicase